ncbi:MAG TPA: hypothetical protein VM716_15635 [Gemmatimonadales bacterium]|nr:hypothetical protein [Gemmatimonadales bacterium]
MKRYVLTMLGAAALAACDLGLNNGLGTLSLSPVLDSIFVGDRLPPLQVNYFDPNGNATSPGPVTWGSSDTTVAKIDAASGAITGRKRGVAVISAQAQNLTGLALIAVSDTLDITLLIDTVYMMPNDTLTVPVVVRKATAPAAAVWFKTPSNTAFTIDSTSGRISALAVGGPLPYIVHADSLADTGAVIVMTLSDTTGGMVFYSVRGTANTHVSGTASAMNYVALGGKRAFQFNGLHLVSGHTTQVVEITRPDSVIAAGAYTIDSLSPTEFNASPTCAAPRPWAAWDASSGTIRAYSRQGGTLSITQVATIPNGQAISGHFTFIAQRTDLYFDPLGALAITGSFVAPLVAKRIC